MSLLVGLAGDAAAGKERVAAVFGEWDFVHFSTSELVREKITAAGLRPSRALQTKVANDARQEHGSGYFLEQALERLAATGKEGVSPERVILSGLYALCEGQYLKTRLRGTLVGVTAHTAALGSDDLALRYARLSERADGSRDTLSYAEFCAAHTRENAGASPLEANVAQLMAEADYTIVNDNATSMDDLRQQVAGIVGQVVGEKV